MARRLLVTGASGMVGREVLAEAARGGWEAHAVSRSGGSSGRGVVWHTVNTHDDEALRRAFGEIQPEAVIHAAGIAGIDYCEEHPDEARAANIDLTRSVAALTRKCEAKLVFVSTDNVFDGRGKNYTESSPVAPVNYYGKSKAAGERVVEESMDRWAVGRCGLVLGLPRGGQSESFMGRLVDALQRGREIGFSPQEIRTPIDVVTLARALVELAGNDFKGIVHLAGNTAIGRLELAQRVAVKLGYRADHVQPLDPAMERKRAPRPRDVSLSNARARSVLKTRFCGIEEAFERFLPVH